MRNKLIKWLGGYTFTEHELMRLDLTYSEGTNDCLVDDYKALKKLLGLEERRTDLLQAELSKANEQILAYEHEKKERQDRLQAKMDVYKTVIHYGVNDVKKATKKQQEAALKSAKATVAKITSGRQPFPSKVWKIAHCGHAGKCDCQKKINEKPRKVKKGKK